MRINKYIAESGLWSRREADRMIASGRVMVNKKFAQPGLLVSGLDEILVDGRPLNISPKEKVLIAFNKPRGIVCSASAKDRAENVIDFIDYGERIFYIGRLDKDSQGLLLLTNRGELVNLVNKLEGAHEKEYLVSCVYPLSDDFLKKMEGPMMIEVPDRAGLMKKVRIEKCRVKRKNNFSFYITLYQGYNRQIRRMCEALGNKVDTIKRIRVMNIRLGTLAPGKYRLVTGRELKEFEKELGI